MWGGAPTTSDTAKNMKRSISIAPLSLPPSLCVYRVRVYSDAQFPHSVLGGTRCAAKSVMMAYMQRRRRAVVTATMAVMFSMTQSCLI